MKFKMYEKVRIIDNNATGTIVDITKKDNTIYYCIEYDDEYKYLDKDMGIVYLTEKDIINNNRYILYDKNYKIKNTNTIGILVDVQYRKDKQEYLYILETKDNELLDVWESNIEKILQ